MLLVVRILVTLSMNIIGTERKPGKLLGADNVVVLDWGASL